MLKNKTIQAKRVLAQLHAPAQAAQEYTQINHQIQYQPQSRWQHLFSKRLLLPLIIAVGIAIFNQLTGINTFLQYAPDILHQAGIHSNITAMLGSLGIGLINFICTCIAIAFIDRLGRRRLLLTGISGLLIAELFLGFITDAHFSPHTTGIAAIICLLVFIFFYAIGPGVVVWLAISELFPTAVRAKGIALCLFLNSLAGTLLASLFLDLQVHLGVSATYYLCAGFSVGYYLLAYFYLPETKAKSLEDIQRYFQQKAKSSLYSVQEGIQS